MMVSVPQEGKRCEVCAELLVQGTHGFKVVYEKGTNQPT